MYVAACTYISYQYTFKMIILKCALGIKTLKTTFLISNIGKHWKKKTIPTHFFTRPLIDDIYECERTRTQMA